MTDEEKVKALEAALEPFARFYDEMPRWLQESLGALIATTGSVEGDALRVQQFRNAREVLAVVAAYRGHERREKTS